VLVVLEDNVTFFDPPRYDTLDYGYFIPDFTKIEAWVKRDPTLIGVSPNTICPGCISFGEEDIWLCMATIDKDEFVDVHWVHWSRATKEMKHIQQLFRRGTTDMWTVTIAVLDSKPQDGYCPTCKVKLEWLALAEKCPNCWWVKL
jgi:hypothetical protein